MKNNSAHDIHYEWKAVTLLSFGFGLVGLDRWIIAPLFPSMVHDLHLNYGQLGTIFGIFSITWGLSSIVFGSISDNIGRRKILVLATLLFSLLSITTGLATSFVILLLVRAIMGITEGAYAPVGLAAAAEASADKRKGLNQGLMCSLFALFGVGLAPIIATHLLNVVPSWRWIFAIVALPGFVVALFLKIIREPAHISPERKKNHTQWRGQFRHKNVYLVTLALCCAMMAILVLTAFIPNYLTDYLHLSGIEMGFVAAALGFGGFLGEFVVAGSSDVIGRRLTAISAFLLAAIFLTFFSLVTSNYTLLFCLLFIIAFFCFGLLALMTGPIASEAVDPAFISSSIGIVAGIGEIVGGGVGPIAAGEVADLFGIRYVLYLSIAALILGAVVSLFFEETAPNKISIQYKYRKTSS